MTAVLPGSDAPLSLPADAPEALKQAEKILRAATLELVRMAEHITLWEAMTTDTALHQRLGGSGVATVTLSLYLALQDAIVLGLARIFDKRALNIRTAFNAVGLQANADWLREHRRASAASEGVILVDRYRLSPQEQADQQRIFQEINARIAVAGFDQRWAAFDQARTALKSGEVKAALRRLIEMRDKEVAHHEVDAVWETSRPRQRDLRLVYDAARRLVWDAYLLLVATDHNDLRDIKHFSVRARCFLAVLRPESPREYEAARRNDGPELES